MVECLARCPATLESCYIGGWGDDGFYIWLHQNVQHTLTERLRCLLKLEFHMCCIHNDEALTCLQTLTSLSISHSEIGQDMKHVTRLTDLKCLELVDCCRYGGIYGSLTTSGDEWTTFEAWPALRKLKLI